MLKVQTSVDVHFQSRSYGFSALSFYRTSSEAKLLSSADRMGFL